MNIRTYPAALVRVIDGDTMVMRVDHGMNISSEQHLRLLDVSCPELDEPGGKEATEAATVWMAKIIELYQATWPFIIQTVKNRSGDEKRTFIRYLATIYPNTPLLQPLGQSLNQWLVENRFGTTS